MAGEEIRISAQQAALQNLLRAVRDNPRGSHLLSGASGVGKTWIASQLKSLLEKTGEWKVLYCPCPEWASHQPYSPFELGLAQTLRSNITSTGAKYVATAVRDIPFVGNTTSAALSGLLELKREKRLDLQGRLSKEAQEVCFKLQKIIGDSRAVIILDDAHWIDKSSCSLVRALSEPELSSVFKFFSNTHTISIATPEQANLDIVDLATSLGVSQFDIGTLSPCTESEFLNALRVFGLNRQLDKAFVASIYNILGGHLKIAKHIVDLLNSGHLLDNTPQADAKRIIQFALEHKLKSLGTIGAEIHRLLSRAVSIGNSFSVNELSCLVNLDTEVVQRQLDSAEQAMLIQRSGRQVAFAHSVVKEYFEDTVSGPHTMSDHEKFAQCLKLIRPGLYGLRAAHLAQAGYHHDAVVLAICDALSRFRNGETAPWNEVTSLAKKRAPSLVPLVQFLENAYTLFEQGEYFQVCEICSGIVSIAPSLISTEASILWGRALVKSSNRDEKNHAVQVLREALQDLTEDETELWGRSMLYLAVAEAYAGDVKAARAAGKRLSRVLERRLDFDPASQALLNRFRLRADMFFSDDIAAAELESARYDLVPDDGAPLDPVQAYIALCNSSGNALYRGYFQEALSYSAAADEILKNYGSLKFPRMDILGNNQILSAWLTMKLTTRDFAVAALDLVEAAPPSNDSGILRNNLAVALVLSGKAERAVEILQSEFNRFAVPENSDFYDQYFLGNNLAGCLFELHRKDEARVVWERLRGIPQRLPYSIRDFLTLRHSIQDALFDKEGGYDGSWDNFPRAELQNRIGTQWRFFGRGFLVSELQFWSDD